MHNLQQREKLLPIRIALLLVLASAFARAEDASSNYRISYYANGRICVDSLGKLDGNNPITKPQGKGQEDFKPSWSKTGDMLVFFRRVKNDPVVTNWKTVVCVIKADGTGLQKLTDDKHTNFNPTWTRDGKNSLIWNRKHPSGSYIVMRSEIGSKPEQCVALTDESYHNWAHSTLSDGRILVESAHPTNGYGYYLMTPGVGGKSTYQRINDGGLLQKGLMARISISPDEKKICFGHIQGHKFKETGHAMTIADFDVKNLKFTNPKVFANKEHKPAWYAYPRWTRDGKAVIYHANTTGKGRLFLYTLKTGSTKQVSKNDDVDFRYPHVEDAPK
jgi:Tol biopolymer transport system component